MVFSMNQNNQQTTEQLLLTKRKWHYLQKPASFEISACNCGNSDLEWSEFEKHVWCSKCKIDFIPKHGGVFDGPIGMGAASLLGMSFDRFNLETNKIERFNMEKLTYERSHG